MIVLNADSEFLSIHKELVVFQWPFMWTNSPDRLMKTPLWRKWALLFMLRPTNSSSRIHVSSSCWSRTVKVSLMLFEHHCSHSNNIQDILFLCRDAFFSLFWDSSLHGWTVVASRHVCFIRVRGCNAAESEINITLCCRILLIRTDKRLDDVICRHLTRYHLALCSAAEQICSWELLWGGCCFEFGLHANSYYLCHSTSGSAGVMKRNIPPAPEWYHGTVISAAHTSDTDAHTSFLWMQHDRFL